MHLQPFLTSLPHTISIGRLVFRAALEHPEVQVVAVNDLIYMVGNQ
jgi:hypothetical protein